MNSRTVLDLENLIEHILYKTIEACVQYNWDEDYITRRILVELRNNLNNQTFKSILPVIPDFKVFYNLYKATGNLETKFGDIAMIFRIKYENNHEVEGVTFLEAKKRYKDSAIFRKLDFSQLKRIDEKTKKSMLLLYDFEDIVCGSYQLFPSRRAFKPKSATTQNSLAINYGKNDLSLYRICYPFSYQISQRFVNGYDLEFHPDIINQVKGYLDKNELPKYLAYFNVIYSQDIDTSFNLNSALYKEII